GAVGTVFGALILTILVDIFLIMGVRTYYVPIMEGVILLIAVLGLGGGMKMPDWNTIKLRLPASMPRADDRRPYIPRVVHEAAAVPQESAAWLRRNAQTLRFIVPAYVILIVVLAATATINGVNFKFGTYLISLLTFGSFLAI